MDKYLAKIHLEKSLNWLFEKKVDKTKRWPKLQYSKWDLIFQTIRGFMQWYANPTELVRTINDPLNTCVSWVSIASQATFSRFICWIKEKDVTKLKWVQRILIIKYLETLVKKNKWEKIESIDVSDDSTKVITYGNQEWSEYISHYNVVWYHPDLITEDETRLIMSWVLRNWAVYSSNWSELLLQEIIDLVKPYVKKIIFRADSAYANPKILNVLDIEWLELEVYIKAKTYQWRLLNNEKRIEFKWINYHILDLPKEYFEEKNEDWMLKLVSKYFTINHKCDSRKKEEIIVCKVNRRELEWKWKSLFAFVNKDVEMLIVRWENRWELAFKEYGKRWKQEQIMDEFKNDMFAKNLSHAKKIQNECEFFLKVIAHNLMQILRLETLEWTKYANCRTRTFRMMAFRIWGKIVKHARGITIKLAETFPFQKRFRIIMERIPWIQFSLC